jgi:ParB/RepB/Spo0J family partition protein
MRLKVSEIIVRDRYRKDFGDLNELALSINEYGLIQPIVVTPEGDKYRLLAGERRLRAHQILKRDEIEAIPWDQLTEIQKLEIELEENLHRKEFEWQEEVEIKLKIDQLKRREYGDREVGRSLGNWTITDTAKLLGISKAQVSIDLEIARGFELHPEIKKEKTKKAAFNKLRLLEAERLRKELLKRQRRQGIKVENLVHGDCLKVLDDIAADTVHLVVIDPPYGINYDEFLDEEQTSGYTTFDDDTSVSLTIINEMLTKLHRVMAPNSSIYMFFAITYYEAIKTAMLQNFQIDPIPLIWYKHNIGGGQVTVPDLHQCRSYETILYGRKGQRRLIKQGQPNVLIHDGVPARSKIHLTEKPVALLKDLIERSSVEGELVLDACAGSGSTLVAAKQLHRNFIGIEKNETYYHMILKRLTFDAVREAERQAARPKTLASSVVKKAMPADILAALAEYEEEIND